MESPQCFAAGRECKVPDECISLSVRYFGGWVECMGECVWLLCFVQECYVAGDIKRECMGFVVGCCVMSGTSPACCYSQPGWVALGGNLGRNVVIQVFRQSDNPSCLAVQVLGGQRGLAKGDRGTEAGCKVDTGMDTQWLIGECYYNYPRMPPKRVPRSPPSVGGGRSKLEPNCSPHSGGRENLLTWRVFKQGCYKDGRGIKQ